MSTSSGHPLRRLLLLALVIGAIVVVRNATADRGGSYDPAAAESGHDGAAESGHDGTAESGHDRAAESGHDGAGAP
jgi:hypothetical protein